MKTAITQLIDNLQQKINESSNISFKMGLKNAIEEAKNLIETEKQQIIDAYEYAAESEYQHFVNGTPRSEMKSAEEYYNQTFKQE